MAYAPVDVLGPFMERELRLVSVPVRLSTSNAPSRFVTFIEAGNLALASVPVLTLEALRFSRPVPEPLNVAAVTEPVPAVKSLLLVETSVFVIWRRWILLVLTSNSSLAGNPHQVLVSATCLNLYVISAFPSTRKLSPTYVPLGKSLLWLIDKKLLPLSLATSLPFIFMCVAAFRSLANISPLASRATTLEAVAAVVASTAKVRAVEPSYAEPVRYDPGVSAALIAPSMDPVTVIPVELVSSFFVLS